MTCNAGVKTLVVVVCGLTYLHQAGFAHVGCANQGHGGQPEVHNGQHAQGFGNLLECVDCHRPLQVGMLMGSCVYAPYLGIHALHRLDALLCHCKCLLLGEALGSTPSVALAHLSQW